MTPLERLHLSLVHAAEALRCAGFQIFLCLMLRALVSQPPNGRGLFATASLTPIDKVSKVLMKVASKNPHPNGR